jgi:hypothetical protein
MRLPALRAFNITQKNWEPRSIVIPSSMSQAKNALPSPSRFKLLELELHNSQVIHPVQFPLLSQGGGGQILSWIFIFVNPNTNFKAHRPTDGRTLRVVRVGTTNSGINLFASRNWAAAWLISTISTTCLYDHRDRGSQSTFSNVT